MADEQEFANDFIFKICVIGDGAVGKTSLIKRFTAGSFNKDYIKTLGAQFSRYEKIMEIDGKKIRSRLFLWDIAGQKEFSFMRPTFYNGAKATIIVYDTSRDETRTNIVDWYEDIKKYCGDLPTVCFGNKSDLIEEDKYDSSEIDKISEDLDFIKVYLTSAKTGKSVTDAFNSIIEVLVKRALSETG